MADEKVVVEEVWKLTDEVSKPLDALKNKSREVEGSLGKVNKAFEWMGKFGLATMGIGAVAQVLGGIKDKAIEAANALDETEDKLAGAIWLLRSQGLISGPDTFAGAMKNAGDEMLRFREMAREGTGDPHKYAQAWSALSRPILLAGGNLHDVERFTKALIPITSIYGDTATQALLGMLTGVKRVQPEMLALFNVTKQQVAKWKDGSDAIGTLRQSIESLMPIAEAQTEDIAVKLQKAQDESAHAWAEAGKAWAPFFASASLLVAKGITPEYYSIGGAREERLTAQQREIFKAWKELSFFQQRHVIIGHDYIGQMKKDLADAGVDINKFATSDLAETGKKVNAFGEEVDEAAEALGDAAKAIKDFSGYMQAIADARTGRGIYGGTFGAEGPAFGGQMTIDELMFRGAILASQAGVPLDERTDEVVVAFGELAKGVYDAGLGLMSLREIADSPLTKGLVPNILKSIMDSVYPASLAALRDSSGKKGEGLEKRPDVRVDKVEIRIDARHQDPDRLASAVFDQFGRKAARGLRGPRTAIPFGG